MIHSSTWLSNCPHLLCLWAKQPASLSISSSTHLSYLLTYLSLQPTNSLCFYPLTNEFIHSSTFPLICSSFHLLSCQPVPMLPHPQGSLGSKGGKFSHLNPLGAPISDLLIFFFPERFLSAGPGPGAGRPRYRELVMSGFWMLTVTSPRDSGPPDGPVEKSMSTNHWLTHLLLAKAWDKK